MNDTEPVTVIVAVATNSGVEWVRGTVDRFIGDRVRVVLDDGRTLPYVAAECCWSVN